MSNKNRKLLSKIENFKIPKTCSIKISNGGNYDKKELSVKIIIFL